MPYIPTAGELKTKPTQHSVKELRSIGIQPDILLVPLPTARSRRTSAASSRCSAMCATTAVIQALDVASIYDVPLAYHAEGLDERSARRLRHGRARRSPICRAGRQISERIATPKAR